jgi:hypothetical protein
MLPDRTFQQRFLISEEMLPPSSVEAFTLRGSLSIAKKIHKALGMFAFLKKAFYQIGRLSINGQEN